MPDLRQQIRNRCVQPLNRNEEQKLIKAAQDGLQEACDRLLTAFLPLVWQIAEEQVADAHVEAAIAEGVIGLCGALQRFDPVRAEAFAPFAAKTVKRAIRRWSRLANGVHVSRREFGTSYVKDPDTVSLDADFDGVSLHELVADPAQSNEDDLIAALDSRRVYDALHCLTPAEREIVKAHYQSEQTLEDIAQERGCSKQAVQQTETRAMAKLRKVLAA